jgi:small GTP-binding protein
MKDYLNIVVVGEVDAGKSTLIGRFLYEMESLSQGVIEEIKNICQRLGSDFEFAYLLDSLEEERRNQLTIDTTQVFCKTRRGREFVFIDVPGHQELLKNMLCGSSYADIAILVVDVQKSIEQQTKRHAFVLKFLGIEQIVIVLNKMDLIDFNEIIFKKVKEEVAEFFNKIQLQPKYFIPVSAKEGENLCRKSKKMDWYKGMLLISVLNTCFKKKRTSEFRFPIQDLYSLNGEKVAVGAIVSGKIGRGEKVKIMPLGSDYRIKAIKVFKRNIRIAKAPESIGLIFDEMQDISRGKVVCKPPLPVVNKKILSRIFCVHPINIREKLIFKCATQEVSAWINEIKGIWDTVNLEAIQGGHLLPANSIAEVIISTRNPVVVENFTGTNKLGRFILSSNKDICAIGVVS